MEQLRILLDELKVGAGMTVLDFGCGDGRIAEYLSDTVGAIVTGVDIARYAIALAQQRTEAKRDRLGFYWTSQEAQGAMFAPRTFDRVIAIDSLFFVPDQRAELAALLGYLKPGGKMGVFYLSTDQAGAEQTVLGVALEEMGVTYRVRDLSAQNERHWQRKAEVLRELESAFAEEGSAFLYKNRLAECDGAERFRRYLFIIPC